MTSDEKKRCFKKTKSEKNERKRKEQFPEDDLISLRVLGGRRKEGSVCGPRSRASDLRVIKLHVRAHVEMSAYVVLTQLTAS